MERRDVYMVLNQSAFHPSSLQSTGNSHGSSQVRQMVEHLTAKQVEIGKKIADVNETKAEIDKNLADVNKTKMRLDQMEEQMKRIMEQVQSNQRCNG